MYLKRLFMYLCCIDYIIRRCNRSNSTSNYLLFCSHLAQTNNICCILSSTLGKYRSAYGERYGNIHAHSQGGQIVPPCFLSIIGMALGESSSPPSSRLFLQYVCCHKCPAVFPSISSTNCLAFSSEGINRNNSNSNRFRDRMVCRNNF